MSITDHLSKADYYLFIDFKRDGNLPVSVFTHQEFALARAWGITDMIAFQEEGLISHGMLSYVLAHPLRFTRDKLLSLVRDEVSKRWDRTFSRNLLVSEVRASDTLICFTDHTGNSLERVWFLHVRNRRKDRPAFNTVAILHSITNESTGEQSRPDSLLPQVGEADGLPQNHFSGRRSALRRFRYSAIRVNQQGVFLHSAADVIRQPIIPGPGTA